MKKRSLILIFVIVILIIVSCFFIFRKKEEVNTDAIKFKEEYEKLNGTIRESDGMLYNDVSISEDNPIKYITVKEANDLLKSKKAIIYVGANWCPWCRNMLSPMLDVAKKLDIDTIYYLELDDDKSNYEVKDKTLVKVSNGSKEYYELLDNLSEYLSDYVLTDNEGNSYNTNEKRIYMPFFITVRNNEVVEAKGISRTLEEGQNKYSEMTQNQYDALYNEFYNTFVKLYGTSPCNIDEGCD